MTSPSPPNDDAWRRLGDLLVQRRVDINPRWTKRQVFCRETGVDYRVVSDLERARRTNFSQPMISHLESAYQLHAGNITRILDGGTLEPLEPTSKEPIIRVSQAEPSSGAPTPASFVDAIMHAEKLFDEALARDDVPREELEKARRRLREVEERILERLIARDEARAEQNDAGPRQQSRETGS